MKKPITHGLVSLFAAIMLSGYPAKKVSSQGVAVSVSYQTFYDGLSPYGTWIDYPAYGHVWHPNITGDFRPYLTNGYWDYSTEGWMWTSNYNWGWAPFHYGRWIYDDLYGWLWIPGYEWSPAWVTWGMLDNFYVWAPLMPGVNAGIAFNLWRPAAFYWNIVERDHIYDRSLFNKVEIRDLVIHNINRINIINNFSTTRLHGQYYAKGPDVHEVERFTNRKIEAASIHEVNNSALAKHEGNEIKVYRPAVTNPQPREFRRIDNNIANPVHNNEDRISTERDQQNKNIDHLPVRKAPESIFDRRPGNSHAFGGGERRNKRN